MRNLLIKLHKLGYDLKIENNNIKLTYRGKVALDKEKAYMFLEELKAHKEEAMAEFKTMNTSLTRNLVTLKDGDLYIKDGIEYIISNKENICSSKKEIKN